MKWQALAGLVGILVLVGVILYAVGEWGAARSSARLKEQEAKIEEARQELETQRAAIDERIKANDALDKDLATKTQKIKAMSSRVTELQKQRDQAVARAKIKEAEVVVLQAKLAELDAKRKAMPATNTLELAVKELQRLGY